MNKILLIIVALIVVFGTFTFLGKKNTNPGSQQSESIKSQETTTPVVTEPSSQIVSVTLTDSGFTPKDITVKAGTTVVWLNKSRRVATVNSDDHPTHNLYSFLNLGEFPSSSSLRVVFDKPGKYSYHDHYNASNTATVTVE